MASLSSLTSSLFTDLIRLHLPLLSPRNTLTTADVSGCVFLTWSPLHCVLLFSCWAWAPDNHVTHLPAASKTYKNIRLARHAARVHLTCHRTVNFCIPSERKMQDRAHCYIFLFNWDSWGKEMISLHFRSGMQWGEPVISFFHCEQTRTAASSNFDSASEIMAVFVSCSNL